MAHPDPTAALRSRFAWPERRPPLAAVDWNMDGGGRQLVTELITRRRAKLLLEIGVFLGGSLRTWLEASPDLVVIAVDGWWGGSRLQELARKHGHATFAAQLEHEDGFYHTFLATNWELRDRIIPVRMGSPEALHAIAGLGVRPDVVYLDSDKLGTDLAACGELFPHAIVCGDDWAWGTDRWLDVDAGYPIRAPVKRFVKERGLHLRTHRQTWVADPEPPTPSDALRQLGSDLRMTWRRVRALRRQALDAASALRARLRPSGPAGSR